MPKRNLHYRTVLHIALLLLAVCLLIVSGSRAWLAEEPRPLKLSFQGEYSLDGEPWQPLGTGKLSSLGSKISLRGSFDCAVPEGEELHLYLNHLACYISVNGSPILSATCCGIGACGARWMPLVLPALTTEDKVEIVLRSEHGLGNTRAFDEFLDNLYVGNEDALLSELADSYGIDRILGIVIMVLSVCISGIALAFMVMHLPPGRKLWFMGLMSFCFGGFLTLDAPDITLAGVAPEFCTYAIEICMMLAVLELKLLAGAYMFGSRHKYASIILYVEKVMTFVAFVVCLLDVLPMYDMFVIWVLAQLLLSAVFAVLCVIELTRTGIRDSVILLSCTVLLVAVWLELANELGGWWDGRPLIKVLFTVLFLGYVVYGLICVPGNFRAASQTEKLEKDLQNSRIILTMSQIRSHFIFNILNAISGMCKYDPEKADRTVIRFARYLRGNIDVMQEDRPESFETALRHLEDYVALEQIRFGERIRFTTDVTVSDFELPPLILQPIVENAIKHGLTPKPDGGTILLRTWEVRKTIFISIHDDGVGFDTAELEQKKSVGLSNVTFRIKHMLRGEIDIDSIPRRGTTVTIRIPRQEEKTCA